MKNVLTLCLALITFSFCNSQNLDTKTQNLIKVRYFTASDFYEQGKYDEALAKILEIEEFSNGGKLATAQNLKVKCYVAKKEYVKANEELEILYDLNPSSKVLQDVASYSVAIEEGLENERIELKNRIIFESKVRAEYLDFHKKKNPKESYLSVRYYEGKYYSFSNEGYFPLPNNINQVIYNSNSNFIVVKSSTRKRVGIVDKKGNILNDFNLDVTADNFVYRFSDGYALYRFSDGYALYVINKKGEMIHKLKYTNYGDYGFSSGMLRVINYDDSNYKSWTGYVDTNFNLVIPLIWNYCNEFVGDFAFVGKSESRYSHVIDKTGNIIYELKTGEEPFFKDINTNDLIDFGLITIKGPEKDNWIGKDGKIYKFPIIYGVNKNAQEIIPVVERYTDLYKAINSLLVVSKVVEGSNNIFHFYSTKGVVSKNNYKEFKENHLYVMGLSEDGQSDFFDDQGLPFNTNNYSDLGYYTEQLCPVKINNKWGFADEKLNEVISCEYDEVMNFNEGMSSVKLNDKWGVIDKYGKEIIPFVYDDIGYFLDGYALAKLNGEEIIIDTVGNKIY